MPGRGERAYVYAKACGIIGKSFVGRRIPALKNLSRLSELDRLIFPQGARDLPERELLVDLEGRITSRAVKQIISVVNSFAKPPQLLALLVRSYEYNDVKASLQADRDKPPLFTDIGPFRTVRFEAWPDLKAMFSGTEFAFLLEQKDRGEKGKEEDVLFLQAELDRLYYKKLWEGLLKLPGRDRMAAAHILSEEISLKNAAWVLRLRTYYGMNADSLKRHILDIALKGVSLCADALAALELPLDTRSAWKGWKRESFLNPEQGGSWTLDPRYFQNNAAEYLYHLAKQAFRQRPFSLDTCFCFIKLKQFEEDLLTSMAEGLVLGMPGGDVFSLLEVSP